MIGDKIKWSILSMIIESEGVIRRFYKRDARYEKLLKFKNRYKNKRCFICATGPSLRKEDLELLRGEYTFGLNSICTIYDESDWRPSFYIFQDYPIYEMYSENINLSKDTIVLSGDPLVDYKNGNKIYLHVKWIRFPINWAYHKYEGLQGRPYVKFSKDAYQRVYSGYTVTYSAIQLAMYMGFKEIYLLGVDCNYKGGKNNHFKMMKNEFVRNPIAAQAESDVQRLAYHKALEVANEENVKIYNVSRGGELDVFERKVLEEVLCGK